VPFKKNHCKKITEMKGNLIIITILILVTLQACNNSKKAKPNPNKPPKYALSAEPEFLHQGNLWFLNEKADTLQTLNIEIADTDAKREKGLMYRKSMAKGNGMLFIFEKEERQSFWMKETHIPLDIIFVNAEKQIVHITENTQPYSLKSIPSFEYAQYVVEVNAGYCKQNEIIMGNKITYKAR
jgi:uncharacterized membrane protein (UPF0127 family)